MNMKKYFKKISAFLLAAVMVLAMCTTAFAAEGDKKPTAADKAAVKVMNVKEGLTVTAYQIADAEYNDYGFVRYNAIAMQTKQGEELKIADVLNPTSEEITTIANRISNGQLTTTLKSVALRYGNGDGETGYDGIYHEELQAGYWIVLVTAGTKTSLDKVYNPMLAGVYYRTDGTGDNNSLVTGQKPGEGGDQKLNTPIDATSHWDLAGVDMYAKSNTDVVTVDKKIIGSISNPDNQTHAADAKGDDIAFDDYAKFQLTSRIPDYSKQYTQATFKITDTTTGGLEIQNETAYPVEVKVGNVKLDPTENGKTNYTVTVNEAKNELIVDFDSAYVLANGEKDVVVTYYAKLDKAKANINFDANTNTAKVTYSNNPTLDTNGKTPTTDTPEDKTYHYTFALDAALSADPSKVDGDKKTTTELIKTDGGTQTQEDNKTTAAYAPLKDATFTLTNNATGKVYEKTTDDAGELHFKGLDAGTYTLVETKAPKGYTINKTVYTVKIEASYNTDGTLDQYSVTISDGSKDAQGNLIEAKSIYQGTYQTDAKGTVVIDKITINQSENTEIRNTKISALPSTGGMGTYLFTIAGVVIMAVAAGIFFVSRKKES